VSDQRSAVEHPAGDEASPRWFTTKQAATYLGIIPRTLYRLIDSGELPAYRFGRVIRLQGDEIDVSSTRPASNPAPSAISTAKPPTSSTTTAGLTPPTPILMAASLTTRHEGGLRI
jgi:excisionase family DNA binding protein